MPQSTLRITHKTHPITRYSFFPCFLCISPKKKNFFFFVLSIPSIFNSTCTAHESAQVCLFCLAHIQIKKNCSFTLVWQKTLKTFFGYLHGTNREWKKSLSRVGQEQEEEEGSELKFKCPKESERHAIALARGKYLEVMGN